MRSHVSILQANRICKMDRKAQMVCFPRKPNDQTNSRAKNSLAVAAIGKGKYEI